MTTSVPSTALATIQPAFTDAERLALAGYRGLTREAYALDLRQFTSWCRALSLGLFAVRRADIESGHPQRRTDTRPGQQRLGRPGPRAHVRRVAAFHRPHQAVTQFDDPYVGGAALGNGCLASGDQLGAPRQAWNIAIKALSRLIGDDSVEIVLN